MGVRVVLFGLSDDGDDDFLCSESLISGGIAIFN